MKSPDSNSIEYEATPVASDTQEIFSGGLNIAMALQKLRARLLDLSTRNRLLNFKHPKGRSMQYVAVKNMDVLFDRILDGRQALLLPVPEPDPKYIPAGTAKPDAKEQAKFEGISTSFDLAEPIQDKHPGPKGTIIQTLLYPADLEKQARKISTEARTVIEETGSNMLYLVFGFLEFYDSDASEKPLLAPLLSVPVSLTKGNIDPDTHVYNYSLSYTGEDVAENYTLREKLKQDFRLNLPELGDDECPEEYFRAIQDTVSKKARWRVRRQLSLAMLAFGKLAIWADLDPNKWPDLLKNDLLKNLFEGGGGSGDGNDPLMAEDYEIDGHAKADLPIIYDADSSQHSALIDALDGKNMVINGPPGTGKSQTITNIIAAALQAGKKVLFVSEKLAALEVVRHRLDRANLGHFCLELHSHKTQKKKLLEDIQARIDEKFTPQNHLAAKLAVLTEQKKTLQRHAEIMGLQVANKLGLTVAEVFWAAERPRQELGDLDDRVHGLAVKGAWDMDHGAYEVRRAVLNDVGEKYRSMGGFGRHHPWWGFWPNQLTPGDERDAGDIASKALAFAQNLTAAAEAIQSLGKDGDELSIVEIIAIADAAKNLPEPPAKLVADQLPVLFDHTLADKPSLQALASIIKLVNEIRTARAIQRKTLLSGANPREAELKLAEETAFAKIGAHQILKPEALDQKISELKSLLRKLRDKTDDFSEQVDDLIPKFEAVGPNAINAVSQAITKLSAYPISETPLSYLRSREHALADVAATLNSALGVVTEKAAKWHIPFDGSVEAVRDLANPIGLADLIPTAEADEATIAEAKQWVTSPFANRKIDEIEQDLSALRGHINDIEKAHETLTKCAQETGQAFDGTTTSVSELICVSTVASRAPEELLSYRKKQFEHPRHPEVLKKAKDDHGREALGRRELGDSYFLDALPGTDELKWAARVFREGDSFFNIFKGDWRKAKKLYKSIAQVKSKHSADTLMKECLKIAEWQEHRQTFLGNKDYSDWLGELFNGVDTDFEKIDRLAAWYRESQEALISCGSLADRFDLTGLDHRKIGQLSARTKSIETSAQALNGLEEALATLLPQSANPRDHLKTGGWNSYLEGLKQQVEHVQSLLNFFKTKARGSVSPQRTLELLEAKRDLANANQELATLIHGGESIAQAAGPEFADLAALSSRPWHERIEAVQSLSTQLGSLAGLLDRFVDESTSPKAAIRFLNSKMTVDHAVEAFSEILSKVKPTSWDGYIQLARNLEERVESLLGQLESFAEADHAASSVIKAIEAKVAADFKDELLLTDPDIQRYFGLVLDSESTDLEALDSTWNWGSTIANSPLPRFIKFAIINEGPQTLSFLRKRASTGQEAYHDARTTLETLSQFGRLDWSEWLRQTAAGDDERPANFEARIKAAVDAADDVLSWARYFDTKRNCDDRGLSGFVLLLEQGQLPPEALPTAFERVFYASIGKEIYRQHKELAGFSGQTHDKLRADFMALDKEIIKINGLRIAHEIDKNKVVPSGTTGIKASDQSEMFLLRRELGKSKRHVPIRQLVKRAGRALQALKPCFMMGPLSVAQYLEPGSLDFDLVVMDEASQLRPEDALGAVARGKQLIVVGDPKQLPPTSFFDRMADGADDDDNEETPAALDGSESILDICQQLFSPVRTLRWHYRSQHESLIAFSNFHFYKSSLVVFPSPYERGKNLGVSWRYVKEGSYKDRRNIPEAVRIVDAVVEHILKSPEESLGVVSLNQTQRDLIQDLLEKKLKSFDEGDRFLADWEEKGLPFFVKNLENVQGDERDVIFISTTYGKAPGTDKVRQNFGPISRPDGWRRLNVLFTRSRRRLVLFSSMQPEDIVIDEKSPAGTKALRDYLDFAKRGVLVATDYTDREPDSDFEISVANVLTSQGYEVKPQLGVANFFIDMAVRNPDRPGEFIAGIECDGATYHSSASARDRDRIRQEILEALGWRGRIWRIWSADWFYNPRQETKRLIEFLEERRRLSALEAPAFSEETELEEEDDDVQVEAPAIKLPIVEIVEPDGTEADDAFVDVGNVVTYCFIDKPQERHTIHIVEGHSTATGTIGEDAPLAIALLGLEVGEVGIMVVEGRADRKVRVLKIEEEAVSEN